MKLQRSPGCPGTARLPGQELRPGCARGRRVLGPAAALWDADPTAAREVLCALTKCIFPPLNGKGTVVYLHFRECKSSSR